MSDLKNNREDPPQNDLEEVDLDRVLATDAPEDEEDEQYEEEFLAEEEEDAESDEEELSAEEEDAESDEEELLAEEDVDRVLDDISEEEKEAHRKRVRTYNRVRRVLLLCMIVIFVYAAYSLADIYLNYQRSNQTYAEVQSLFYVDVTDEETSTASEETVTVLDDNGETVYATANTSITGNTTKWVWNYQKLLEVNEDAVGWISLADTVIDYPILQGADNDTYLHASVYGDYAYAGSIFVDYRNTLGLEGHYCVVYGHNMNNGSMFGSLKKFKEASYLKEHPYFDIYIGEKHYIYYIYSLYIVEPYETADSPYQFGYEVIDTDEKREAYESFLADTVSKSMYTVTTCPKTEITADDYVITLSTCSGTGANKKRMVVHLVRCEEVVD